MSERGFLLDRFLEMARVVIPYLRNSAFSKEDEENMPADGDSSYFRMVGADALFSAFFLLSEYRKDEGVDQFFSLFGDLFTRDISS